MKSKQEIYETILPKKKRLYHTGIGTPQLKGNLATFLQSHMSEPINGLFAFNRFGPTFFRSPTNKVVQIFGQPSSRPNVSSCERGDLAGNRGACNDICNGG